MDLLKNIKEKFKILKKSDLLIITLPVIITIIGIMTIYSATRPIFEINHPYFYIQQIFWLQIGCISMLGTSLIDYRKLLKFAYPIYIVCICLLILTILMGHVGMGAQRWIRIGPIGFQPSEFFKIGMLITLSAFLNNKTTPLKGLSFFSLFLFFGVLPFILLYLQPDLGSGVLMLMIVGVITIIKGVKKEILIAFIITIILSIPLIGGVVWKKLKQYQRNRLVAFIDPKIDPKGIGYQIKQSKITIGSGKIFGKGYLKGTQGPFRFLPEKHTDFIFSVFAEEWGFLGSVFLLFLYLLLILRGYEIAYYAKDDFGFFLATGISTMFLLYLSINIGMTMGLMPVVGIPLPFFSYGGTALLTNFISIGILNTIKIRRYKLFY